jgi:hypothetical protein
MGIKMMYLQSAFTNSKPIVKICLGSGKGCNMRGFLGAKMGIKMMYLQSAFTNSKPIVKIDFVLVVKPLLLYII